MKGSRLHLFPGLLAAVSIVALCFSGCGNSSAEEKGNVFRYNETAAIQSLDPIYSRSQASIWPAHHIFSTLVELDENLELIPGIAHSWEVHDSIYLFHLRTKIPFHPHPSFASPRYLQAEDVVYSLGRLQDSKWGSPGAWTMQAVKNVEAINDSTVQITLKKAFSPFLRILSMKYCSIVPKEAVEYVDLPFGEHPSGTGAYYLKRWVSGEKLILRRFHDWYHPMPENGVEALVIHFIPDKLSAFLSFVQAKLDFVSGFDVSFRDNILDENAELREKYREIMHLETTEYLNTEYLAFDLQLLEKENSPYAKPELRKAIHAAIDKKLLVNHILKGLGTKASTGMIPPVLLQQPLPAFEFNPEYAREVLKQAGYPNGKGLPELVLTTNPGYQDMAELIQNQLSKVGIPLKVDVVPASTLRQQMSTGKSAFFRASWIADYPDAENYMLLFYSKNIPPSGPNYSRMRDETFDALYESLQTLSSGTQRDSLLLQMHEQIRSYQPVIPLFYDRVIRLRSPKVKNLPLHPMNVLDVRFVEMVEPTSQT